MYGLIRRTRTSRKHEQIVAESRILGRRARLK
jgi:hypothetical protein